MSRTTPVKELLSVCARFQTDFFQLCHYSDADYSSRDSGRSGNLPVLSYRWGQTQWDSKKTRLLWEKHEPGHSFVYIDAYQQYISNNTDMVNFSRLLLAYAIISLFLTLFGIFGITWYAVEQRKREIAIRKVHGASSRQILLLLNRSVLLLYSDSRCDCCSYRICLDETVEGTVCVSCELGNRTYL